ncbi:MAG: hypothetical protein PHI66_03070 [Candidatus Pacebacteria bacterium]|nr:hypothetical protein [Candidatus Paceibacterota bacterium]
MEEKGWLGKLKETIYENWQTILVALVVLIVGVSAYNYNNDSKNDLESAPIVSLEENNKEGAADQTTEQEEVVEQEDQEVAEEEDQKNVEVATEEVQEKGNEAPAVEEEKEDLKTETITKLDDELYEVTAEKGDGVTHLARKALNEYLQENGKNELTDLHMIYIEDYIQNKTSSETLEVGQNLTFSRNLIAEAISSSERLSETALENLKKYSA